MNERQRERLLDRIYQPSSTVGETIPETAIIDGEPVPIRSTLFELSDSDAPASENEQRIRTIIRGLKRERLRKVNVIKRSDVDYERGEEIVQEILELDRAINAFESVHDPDLDEQMRHQKIDSANELVELMRQFGKR